MTPQYLALLRADEGTRLLVYDDATGATLRPGYTLQGNPTIGVGRNLIGRGINQAESDAMLARDVAEAESWLASRFSWFASLTDGRRYVLTTIYFNTGSVAGWPKMLAAMARQDWTGARAELLNSKAARQLPERYARLADILLKGDS